MNWFWLQCMFLDFLSLEESFFDALLLLYLFCVTQFNVKFKNVGLTFNIFFLLLMKLAVKFLLICEWWRCSVVNCVLTKQF